MLNPFGSSNIPGSYFGLRDRLFRKLKSAEVDKQIYQLLQNAYEGVLDSENIVLARVERKRLMADLSSQILTDLAKEIKSKT